MTSAAVTELAKVHGVTPAYRDITGARQAASVDALVGVLRALGVPIERPADAPELLAATPARDRPLVEPVVVAWHGEPIRLPLHVTAADAHDEVHVEVVTEDGERLRWTVEIAPSGAVTLPHALTVGYHELRVQLGPRAAASLLVVAPRSAPEPRPPRSWGVFAPVYALWHDAGPGCDFSALERLATWTGSHGGSVVATLPLLTAFLEEPRDPSPYRPVSRRFWNEVFVDCARLPELADDDVPVDVPTDRGFVDLPALMARKRPVLERAAARLGDLGGRRHKELDAFVDARPDVVEYARFRAAVEQFGADRSSWPGSWRSGAVPPADVDPDRVRFHVYAQFVADEQLAAVGDALRARGQLLYLDLPVGAHPDGFDVYRDTESFASGASVGAPPDEFFDQGQNWGFPPPHPIGMRHHHYRDLRAALAHHLRHAGMLRLDHVMGLHRLWWVPETADAADGAYVQYPADELYAIACLEAHRHDAALAGENLGTVPPEVDQALADHALHGTFVGQFAMDATRSPVMRPPGRRTVAALNTHDTATFPGFWAGTDVEDRRELDLIADADARRELEGRAELRAALVRDLMTRREVPSVTAGRNPTETDDDLCRAVLGALLVELGESDADVVVVSADDLVLEQHQQNLPGTTGAARANFCRRLPVSLDDLDQPWIATTLARVDAARREGSAA